jgi:hypothetical protein
MPRLSSPLEGIMSLPASPGSEGVMVARTRKYACECGFQVVAHQEEELLEIVQFHLKGAHGKIVSPDAVLAASPPV